MAYSGSNLSAVVAEMWGERFLSDERFLVGGTNDWIKRDPFQVRIERRADRVIVYSDAYRKEIKMRDTFWMILKGKTWEEKVRDAQREAFEAVYVKVMEEERKDHQVNRLK